MKKRSKIALTMHEEREVARLYRKKDSNGKRLISQAELASRFFVAPVTIRRALAEQGLIELVAYKTRKDTELLEVLKAAGLTDPSTLQEVLANAGYAKQLVA